MTADPGGRVAALLRQLRPVADEIVVAADARVEPADLGAYASVADRLLRRVRAQRASPRLAPRPVRGRLDPAHGWRRASEPGADRAAPGAARPARRPPVPASPALAASRSRALARRAALVARLPGAPRPQRRPPALQRRAAHECRAGPAGGLPRG